MTGPTLLLSNRKSVSILADYMINIARTGMDQSPRHSSLPNALIEVSDQTSRQTILQSYKTIINYSDSPSAHTTPASS